MAGPAASRPGMLLLAHGSPDYRHARDLRRLAGAVHRELNAGIRAGTQVQAAAASGRPPAGTMSREPARSAGERQALGGPERNQRKVAGNLTCYGHGAAQLVSLAFLDHHGPTPAEAAAALAGAGCPAAHVLPVFTARAYHVDVDVPAAFAAVQDAGLSATMVEPGLAGSSELLGAALSGAIRAVDGSPRRPAIVFASGSSSRAACARLQDQVAALSASTGRALGVAFLAGGPDLATACGRLADEVSRGGRSATGGAGGSALPVVVPFVVADGIMRDRMAAQANRAALPVAPGSLATTAEVARLIAELAQGHSGVAAHG